MDCYRPFHSKYTGCNWEEATTCKWKSSLEFCLKRVQQELCASLNSNRCRGGKFLAKATGCTIASFLDPGRERTGFDKEQVKTQVSRNDGAVGYWNADPHDSRRCCSKELHGKEQNSCTPLLVHSSACVFPFESEGRQFNTCKRSTLLDKTGQTYLWCSHSFIEIKFGVEGEHWSKCAESDGTLDLGEHENDLFPSLTGNQNKVMCPGKKTCTLGIQTAKDWILARPATSFEGINTTHVTGQLALGKLTTRERLKEIPDWKCKDDERFEVLPPLSEIRKELNLTYEKNDRRPAEVYHPIIWQKIDGEKVECNWDLYPQSGCSDEEQTQTFLDCIQNIAKGESESYCGERVRSKNINVNRWFIYFVFNSLTTFFFFVFFFFFFVFFVFFF